MRLRLTLPLLALMAVPAPVPAGIIRYEFDDAHYPHSEIARMEVADAALARGYFTNSDLLGFGFNIFGARDLNPFLLRIGPDGAPEGGGPITGREIVSGSTYRLTVDFPAGFWQVTTGNFPGVYGDGYWTATIEDAGPTPASVPEPSTAVLAILAAACVVLARKVRTAIRGGGR